MSVMNVQETGPGILVGSNRCCGKRGSLVRRLKAGDGSIQVRVELPHNYVSKQRTCASKESKNSYRKMDLGDVPENPGLTNRDL